MSEKPISDKTNRPSPEKAGSLKSPLLEPPTSHPTEPFPPLDLHHGLQEGRQLSPDDAASAGPLSPTASAAPQSRDANNDLLWQGEPLDQTRHDTVEADVIPASREQNATEDASKSSISSSTRLTPARGHGAPPSSIHGADPLPSRGPSSRPLSRRVSEPLSSRGRRGGWTRPRSYEVVPISTFHLPPTASEDMESSSMAPHEPKAGTLPPDENVPLSPGGAAESPPGQSRTFTYLLPPSGPGIPRALTAGFGPNHPGCTEPLPLRFSDRRNSMSRLGADAQHEMEEGRTRTTLGNALATQTARETGVVQRDFGPMSERPERSRGPQAINMQNMRDPEVSDMVDHGQALIMQDRQEERYDEFWTSPAFQLLIDMWLRFAP